MTTAEPSPMPTPDLGALLRKPAPLRSVSTSPDAEPAAQPSTAPPAGRSETARRSASPRPQTDFQVEDHVPGARSRPYLRSISLYLPRGLHQRLHIVAAQRSTTATLLILTAVNATHESLAGLLTSAPRAAAAEKDLFEVPQDRVRDEPPVATTIRVTDSQHAALAALATRYAVPRSAVIAAALRIYLDAP